MFQTILEAAHHRPPILKKRKLIMIKLISSYMIIKLCDIAYKSYNICEIEEINESWIVNL